MRETELNSKLDAYKAPEPSDLLKTRILKSAAAQTAPSRAPLAKRFMPIAASLLAMCAIGFGTLQITQNSETETTAAWQEAATDLGFEDIYDWVETEEAVAQES